MFFVSVFGVNSPDEYIILKVTQDTSVYEAISQVRMSSETMGQMIVTFQQLVLDYLGSKYPYLVNFPYTSSCLFSVL